MKLVVKSLAVGSYGLYDEVSGNFLKRACSTEILPKVLAQFLNDGKYDSIKLDKSLDTRFNPLVFHDGTLLRGWQAAKAWILISVIKELKEFKNAMIWITIE